MGDLLATPELRGRVESSARASSSMAEAAKLYAATDTVTLPYKMASQSGVLLLSYGFERPVVVYPVGGLPEAVVEGETGWICERADVAALADVLQNTVDVGAAECERRGLAGSRLADERYSWSEIARLTEEVYCEAAGLPTSVVATSANLA